MDERMKGADGFKEKHTHMQELYDELVQKVGDLATENGELLAQCKQLERDNLRKNKDLDMIEEVRSENETLHESLVEAVDLVNSMSEQLSNFAKAHEASVQSYEEQISRLKDELMLTTNCEDASAVDDISAITSVTSFVEENEALLKQVVELKSDKAEAYETCHVLRREIDVLRMALNDARVTEQDEAAYSEPRKVTRLARIDESLEKEEEISSQGSNKC